MSAEYSVEEVLKRARDRQLLCGDDEITRMLFKLAERIKADDGAVPVATVVVRDEGGFPYIERMDHDLLPGTHKLFDRPPAQVAQVDGHLEVALAIEKAKTAKANSPDAADSGRVGDDERQWRELLAIRVAGPMLYTDDGELSDSSVSPHIDFLRDSADTIACKLADRARAALAAQGQGDDATRSAFIRMLERGNHRTDGDMPKLLDRVEHMVRGNQDCIQAQRMLIADLKARHPASPAPPAGVPDACCDICHDPLVDGCACQDEYKREHDFRSMER